MISQSDDQNALAPKITLKTMNLTALQKQGKYHLSPVLYTFKTKSVTETDTYLAILAITIHFPLPEARGFLVLALEALLVEGLIRISKSHINTCSFGSLEIKPTPSLTNDCRKLNLISPTDIDSTGPCKLGSQ